MLNKITKALIRKEMRIDFKKMESERHFFYPLAEPTYSEKEVFSITDEAEASKGQGVRGAL